MTTNQLFEIKRFPFNNNLSETLKSSVYSKEQWPVVYLLSNSEKKEAYIGETTDIITRSTTHLKGPKQNLSLIHLIGSELFNKSATLDIESNLIKYISGDGFFQLMNANIGLSNHTYYQKRELYWDIFRNIWDQMRKEGIAKHSLEHIDNSDLFKYSPYKSLTTEQSKSLLIILKNLLGNDVKITVAKGGAGTGKSILAIFLFKLLHSDFSELNYKEFGDAEAEFIEIVGKLKQKYPSPRMGLVVPMASFRDTLKKVFKNVKGLHPSMVIAPADVTRQEFDILVVDESHRLRRRVNLGSYFRAFDEAAIRLGFAPQTTNELDWILQRSSKTLLFYDESQTIKPSDIVAVEFNKVLASASTRDIELKSQLRVRGGIDYVQFIEGLLSGKMTAVNTAFNNKSYEFRVMDSIQELIDEIKNRNNAKGLSRLIAGYSWEWKSKKDRSLYDISIEDIKLRWNSVAKDWINSSQSINEVGCIHTTQGYDLNYAGVIFGNEISYDFNKKEIVIKPEQYFDRNGKASITNPEDLKKFILNIYKTILLRGIHGTFVYACDASLRRYLKETATSSVAVKTTAAEPLHTIPFYDLQAAAGSFSDLQQAAITDQVALPNHIRYSEDLFCCRVVGESMNKIIPNGSICVFRKYSGGSRNGKIVLVQSADIQDREWGHGFTVKEYRSHKQVNEDGWQHETISLYPVSNDINYKPIDLMESEVQELKVIGVFECVLEDPVFNNY